MLWSRVDYRGIYARNDATVETVMRSMTVDLNALCPIFSGYISLLIHPKVPRIWKETFDK
jgi:hypothetical protein